MRPSPAKGIAPLRLVACVLLLLSALELSRYIPKGPSSDFPSYFYAAVGAGRGASPYDYEAIRAIAVSAGMDHFYPYIYPPPLVHLLKSLPLGDVVGAQAVWGWAMVASYGVLIALLARLLGTRRGERLKEPVPGAWLLLALGAALVVRNSVRLDLQEGQINLLVGALNVAALYFSERRWSQVAGLALALAVLLKVTPIVLVLYLALRRDGRTLAWGAGWLGVLGMADLAIFGLPDWIEFRRAAGEGGFAHSPHGLFPITRAPSGFPSLFAHLLGEGSPWVPRLSLLMLAGMLAALLSVGRRGIGDAARGPAYGATAILMMLASPLVWPHHYVNLIPALALVAQSFVLRSGRGAWPSLILIALATFLALPLNGNLSKLLRLEPRFGFSIFPIVNVAALLIAFGGCLWLWSRSSAGDSKGTSPIADVG